MNWWTKFGCILTGWSSEILAQCSEASRCQLNKYTSALLILILIWGVTGFCFAQRYIGLPTWACAFVSLFFITIVIMIERQIILAGEKTFKILVFRVAIACVMAVIGSTIFDQTLFGKDIDKQMTSNIEKQVAVLTKKRVHIIEEKLNSLKNGKDSIDKINAELQDDINKAPIKTLKTVTYTQSLQTMPNGQTKTVSIPVVTTTQVPNPKIEILEANKKTVKQLYDQETEWTQKKQNMEEEVRKECKQNVGFLEELQAMWTIITTSKLALGFYAVFFLFLISLELFVVVSKLFDKECDYDVALRGAQGVRITQFANAYSRVIIHQQ